MFHCWPLACLLTLVAAFTLRAGEAEQIAAAIERLGDESFVVRQRTIDELADFGQPALEPLDDARASKDPEIRWRAAVAIRRIHDRLQVAALAGEWQTESGDWFKIVDGRWSSGTPMYGPYAGPIRFHENVGKATRVELVVEQGPTAGQRVRCLLQIIGGKLYYCGTYNDHWPASFSGGQGVVYIFKRAKK
jgi:hypothetical protein